MNKFADLCDYEFELIYLHGIDEPSVQSSIEISAGKSGIEVPLV